MGSYVRRQIKEKTSENSNIEKSSFKREDKSILRNAM